MRTGYILANIDRITEAYIVNIVLMVERILSSAC